jgi:type II secretory pathway predicted ATPase ExeA
MYLDLFQLKELPFRLSPDPQFLYLSKAHARAKAYMESTIWFTDGFVIITGDIGSGKTTLIETFLREVERDVVVAQVNQTQVSVVEFLQSVLAQFGFSPFKMKKAELLNTLNQFLIEQYAAGRKVLLIVDEAQNLSLRVLEEIRMLSGIETTKEKVLRIILCGQPEMGEKLDAPELVQLTQRVRLRFHLSALDHEDIQGYISHRLEVAGAEGRTIFAPDTYNLIHRYTGGVPRLLNTLCDTSMLAAYNYQTPQVGLQHVKEAIAELRWPEFAQRPHYRPPERVESERDQASVPIRTNSPDLLRRPPVARLVLSIGGRVIREIPLPEGRFLIGRTTANDLQIDSKFISRHHCQIITSHKACVLEDLNSTNGVLIRGNRVRHHNLNDGDVITLSEHQLQYVDERAHSRAARELADTGPHTHRGAPPEGERERTGDHVRTTVLPSTER